jgi:site-specific recombinase XerC
MPFAPSLAFSCDLYRLQKMYILDHTQVKTTQMYTHLSQDTLLSAANKATVALSAAMMPSVQSMALAV